MKDLKNYVDQNKDRFLSELFELIRIPSVSAQEAHKDDMYRAAQWIAEKLVADGADKAEVLKTDGHPVVYGEKMIDPKLPYRAGLWPLRRAARRAA
jgi:acetylornithine deacetylase/succinyl-diaminopimelate desuccinylase-like protein